MSARDYYDVYWSPEGFNPSVVPRRVMLELLTDLVLPGDSCLDVGCGDGATYGRWLASRGVDYSGVDVSPIAVARAIEGGLTAQVVEDASALQLPDASFDSVLCTEVLEHLFDPRSAVDEIVRILRPGGLLIVTVPNVAYWRTRLDLALLGRWNPLGDTLAVEQPWRDPHIRFFNPRALRRLLEIAGLRVRSVRGFGGGILHDFPWMSPRIRARRSSRLYRVVEARLPSLFGYTLCAVGDKPAEDEREDASLRLLVP